MTNTGKVAPAPYEAVAYWGNMGRYPDELAASLLRSSAAMVLRGLRPEQLREVVFMLESLSVAG